MHWHKKICEAQQEHPGGTQNHQRPAAPCLGESSQKRHLYKPCDLVNLLCKGHGKGIFLLAPDGAISNHSSHIMKSGTNTGPHASVVPEADAEKTLAKRRRKTLGVFSGVQMCHVISGMLIADTKLTVHLKYFKGDTAKYALAMSFAQQVNKIAGLVEVPFLTAFSEARGRRALMVLGASWMFLLRLADFLMPVHRVLYCTTCLTALTTATNQGLKHNFVFEWDVDASGSATWNLWHWA
jgi:hypothetical protein